MSPERSSSQAQNIQAICPKLNKILFEFQQQEFIPRNQTHHLLKPSKEAIETKKIKEGVCLKKRTTQSAITQHYRRWLKKSENIPERLAPGPNTDILMTKTEFIDFIEFIYGYLQQTNRKNLYVIDTIEDLEEA